MKKLLCFLSLFTLVAHAEEEVNPVEQRLREGMRTITLQLREAQNQTAAAQAAQAEAERKIKELEAKLDTITKQAVADRNASANVISELKTKLESETTTNVSYQAAIGKWKKSYGDVTALAAKKEAERVKLEAKSIKLERQVEDQKLKNIAMYKMGMEVLDRYEKFGLGDAVLAREPFVGTTRVKFQNLMQEYADKLADQRIPQQIQPQ
jgi:Tfp pilus assembly protein PilX